MKTSMLYAVAMTAALVVSGYSQATLRNDRKIFLDLKQNFANLEAQARFLATGDRVIDQPVMLVGPRGATSLVEEVKGRPSVVYIEQRGCPFCDWFASAMEKRNPRWKESLVVVSTSASPDSMRGTLGIAPESLSQIPGTPIVLVVDSSGTIRHSALGAKRVLNVLQFIDFDAPTFEDMLRESKR